MSSSGPRRHLELVASDSFENFNRQSPRDRLDRLEFGELVTIGDFDPDCDQAIEYDFLGLVIAGRYTVLARIGGGGMADVFRATDEQLGIDVAIKLLKPRIASDELRARMVQEARAAAQVRHANLVRVFGTGMLDRTAYIAMELLDGPNLEQYLHDLRGQRLPWQQAVTLLLPALEALHAVHDRGHIHRDIKTGNILITRDSSGAETAIVLDLGLVKPERALRNAASPPTTEVGRMLCTPGYTSPEQAAGLPVDRRSDVYSMAVTLYRVLAGRLPFHSARGQPVAVVLSSHMYVEPTPLADAAVGAVIPPALAAVITGALSKRPEDRPATMLAFAEALRAATDDPTTVREHRRARSPHALLLALGLGTAISLLVTAPQRPARDTAAATAVIPHDAALTNSPAPPTGVPDERVPIPAEPLTSGDPPAVSPTPPHLLAATWHRALARRTAEVERCTLAATFGSIQTLTVAVKIDRSGRLSARLPTAPDAPLGRCITRTLASTPVPAPDEPTSFVHVFKLQARPTPR